MFNVIDQYNSFVENNFIKKNKDQIEFLKQADNVWSSFSKTKLFFKDKIFEGIYLYGQVGTGKTFLLNLFYQNTKIGKKIHFNNLMNEIHEQVKKSENKELAIENYVKNLSRDYKIIFIDELHIFNIVDALIIKKIFNYFSKYKIFVLLSSNFHPDNLYKDGLQRNDFLPFIDLIKKNFFLYDISIKTDFRRQTLNQSKTYFTPITTETSNEFEKLFNRFVDPSHLTTVKIKSKSRELEFDKCTSNLMMIDFENLCEVNFGNEDYKNIADKFKLVFLKNVPEFDNQKKDSCRRFIGLIDMLYENNCSIVILASKPINSLNNINTLAEEFKRTASRLYEMTIVKPD